MNESPQLKVLKRHPVLDLPVAGPLLLIVYGEIVNLLLGGILYMVIREPGCYYAMWLLAIGMIVIHRLWFRNEYRGGLYTDSLRDGRFWCLFLILVGIDLAFCIHDVVTNPFVGITVTGFGTSVLAGLLEETGSRYLPISVMMRRYKDKGNFWTVILFTSVVFGLGHYVNLKGMTNFWPVTLQVVVTMASGFAMGAVFLRTGNIGLSMTWHFLHDLLCSMHETVAVENPVIEGVSRGDLIECILAMIVYIVFGILLLKGQQDTIREIWKNRWSEPEE